MLGTDTRLTLGEIGFEWKRVWLSAHLFCMRRTLTQCPIFKECFMWRIFLIFMLLLVSQHIAASELASAPDQVRPILLGSAMPNVNLKTAAGKPLTLKNAVNGKPAVLVFYRGGWCPYCNLQLSDLRLIKKDLDALGYQMIAISPDRPEELSKTLGKTKLEYTLLSDSKADALRAFGIGFVVDAATREKYKGYGIDLNKAPGDTHSALPVPSVFIVDKEGKLQFSYSHPDYSVRVPGPVILSAAKVIAERKQQLKLK
jgi:peroxiredoxin